MVPDEKRDPSLKGGYYTKNGGIWTLRHEIIPQKFYEILIKTELKGDTDLELNNFYNHSKIFLNTVTGL